MLQLLRRGLKPRPFKTESEREICNLSKQNRSAKRLRTFNTESRANIVARILVFRQPARAFRVRRRQSARLNGSAAPFPLRLDWKRLALGTALNIFRCARCGKLCPTVPRQPQADPDAAFRRPA